MGLGIFGIPPLVMLDPFWSPFFTNPSSKTARKKRGGRLENKAERSQPGLDPKYLLGSCCLKDVEVQHEMLNFAPAHAEQEETYSGAWPPCVSGLTWNFPALHLALPCTQAGHWAICPVGPSFSQLDRGLLIGPQASPPPH